jgi:hypothetical protein
MTPIEPVYKALARAKDWLPPSEVAEQVGLPMQDVRLALRELAAAGRAKRNIVGRWNPTALEERWHVSEAHEQWIQ